LTVAQKKMGSRTTIEVAVRFREPSWIIASVGGIGRTRGLNVGNVLRKTHSESIVSGTRNQLKSSGWHCTSSITISPRNDSSAVVGSGSRQIDGYFQSENSAPGPLCQLPRNSRAVGHQT
jgi:hypothetical protein